MTTTADEAALLHAIRAHPAEDTPRLVYADWLDENAGGDWTCPRCRGAALTPGWVKVRDWVWRPTRTECQTCHSTGRLSDGRRERAEFIRVQIALHRHPHGKNVQAGEYDARDGIGPEWQGAFDAQERGRVLWREWSRRWFGLGIARNPVLLTPNEVDPRVRRGFVAEVRLTTAAFMDAAKGLFTTHPIERVVLTDREPEGIGYETFWRWFTDGLMGNPRVGEDPSVLPDEIWRLFHDHPPHSRSTLRQTLGWEFASRDEALAALSAACVAWGRKLAGLPT